MKNLCVVTTTRRRATCFSLLEQWMQRQKLKPDCWLIINDSVKSAPTFNPMDYFIMREGENTEPLPYIPPDAENEYKYTLPYQKVIERQTKVGEGLSIVENWREALKYLNFFEKVVCWDDDDYYHPTMLEQINNALDKADLAGVANTLYYNLPARKFQRKYNQSHSGLGTTGFTRKVMPHLRKLLKTHNDVWIDMKLWDSWEGSKTLINNQGSDRKPLQVSMKGMPGARGLGLGHLGEGSSDRACNILREWLPHDVFRTYIQLHLTSPN